MIKAERVIRLLEGQGWVTGRRGAAIALAAEVPTG